MRGQKHGHKGVFSEEFGRTPIRLTPGCPEMGESPQISFSAKCLWQSLQRLRKPIYTEWPKLQLPCHRAKTICAPAAGGTRDTVPRAGPPGCAHSHYGCAAPGWRTADRGHWSASTARAG